jgi:triosephosphate isomerase
MARPIIIVNCKTYPQATGKNAVRLAKLCETAAGKYNADIRIAVQATDISLVAKSVGIPVYAQHVDPASPGQSTGWITAHAIKAAGARGSLVNHAEHRLDNTTIAASVDALRREQLDAIVCAESVQRLQEIDAAAAGAMMLCVEPPELIGGDISVSVARPEIVTHAVGATKRPLLIGAGIKTGEDLAIALRLGAKGVLLASGIVLAKDQAAALKNLLAER